jgi:uncharacterized protein YkwD
VALALVLAMCAGACSAANATTRRHRDARQLRRGTRHRHSDARKPHRHARRHRHDAVHPHQPALSQGCTNTTLMPSAQDLALIRAATLCLVNRERMDRGEPPLRPNVHLRQAAQGHSESMSVGDYFEHYGPDGQTPLSRMRAAGYISSSRMGFEIGENIAWGTGTLATPSAIVAAWMASPGHRANILNANYRETGIGVSPEPPASLAEGQPGAIYTQDFGVIIGG